MKTVLIQTILHLHASELANINERCSLSRMQGSTRSVPGIDLKLPTWHEILPLRTNHSREKRWIRVGPLLVLSDDLR
nr:hypothetical protein CFP56_03088 [Quercus suber]